MTSTTKFGKVTWPSSHFKGHSIFCKPAFLLFYRWFSKTANLWEIDLKFLGSISDINIDDPEKLHFPKSWWFGFWSVIHSFLFRASFWNQHLIQNTFCSSRDFRVAFLALPPGAINANVSMHTCEAETVADAFCFYWDHAKNYIQVNR